MSILAPSLTRDGKRLLAGAVAGSSTITFTKMALGDGERTGSTSAIGHEIISVEFTNIMKSDEYVTLTGSFNNSDLTAGFAMTELGVYATDGSEEVLFAYTHDEDSKDYIPVSESKIITTELSIIVAIGDATDVTIQVVDSVSTSQIGFTEADTVSDLESGDTVSVLFGKIKKMFSFLNTRETHNIIARKGSYCDGRVRYVRLGNIVNVSLSVRLTLDNEANHDICTSLPPAAVGTQYFVTQADAVDDTSVFKFMFSDSTLSVATEDAIGARTYVSLSFSYIAAE